VTKFVIKFEHNHLHGTLLAKIPIRYSVERNADGLVWVAAPHDMKTS